MTMPGMSSQIVIERLECEGYCGVERVEREHPQKLAIDLDLEFPTGQAAETDNLAQTVDYAAVAERVVALVSRQHCRLLENLAERIVAMLLADFPIERVRIWLRKLHAPLSTSAGSVGVRIEKAKAITPRIAAEPEPAPFLVQQVHRLSKGAALDLAAGTGRNSLYLLQHGMEVEAIDRDEMALSTLRSSAQARSLSRLKTTVLDLEQYPDRPPDLGCERYELIIVFFYLFRPLFAPLLQALKEGGLLVYETFLIDNYFRHHHPRRREFCLAHNELLGLTSLLRVLHYDEGEHHGSSGTGTAFTARLVAQKPVSSKL